MALAPAREEPSERAPLAMPSPPEGAPDGPAGRPAPAAPPSPRRGRAPPWAPHPRAPRVRAGFFRRIGRRVNPDAVGLSRAAHPPLADLALHPGPERIRPARGARVVRCVPAPFPGAGYAPSPGCVLACASPGHPRGECPDAFDLRAAGCSQVAESGVAGGRAHARVAACRLSRSGAQFLSVRCGRGGRPRCRAGRPSS